LYHSAASIRSHSTLAASRVIEVLTSKRLSLSQDLPMPRHEGRFSRRFATFNAYGTKCFDSVLAAATAGSLQASGSIGYRSLVSRRRRLELTAIFSHQQRRYLRDFASAMISFHDRIRSLSNITISITYYAEALRI